MIVPRAEMRDTLARLLAKLTRQDAGPEEVPGGEPEPEPESESAE